MPSDNKASLEPMLTQTCMLTYGVTKPQWVNCLTASNNCITTITRPWCIIHKSFYLCIANDHCHSWTTCKFAGICTIFKAKRNLTEQFHRVWKYILKLRLKMNIGDATNLSDAIHIQIYSAESQQICITRIKYWCGSGKWVYRSWPERTHQGQLLSRLQYSPGTLF